MKKLVIRRAEKQDLSGVANLCRTMDPRDYVPEIWPVWMSTAKTINLVAQVGGRIVGCAHGAILVYPEGWCQAIRVHPEIQRQGIGLSLMAALENEFASMGVRALFGNIGAFNERSLAFFAGQNWKTVWGIKRRLAGPGSGIGKRPLLFARRDALELIRTMPVFASIEKRAVFRRGYFSINDSYLEKAIAAQAVRVSSGGDAYALLDFGGSNSEKRIWVTGLAGSGNGIQQLLEGLLEEAGTVGTPLIVDSTDDPELQAMMDAVHFKPPGKTDTYFVVKKELVRPASAS